MDSARAKIDIAHEWTDMEIKRLAERLRYHYRKAANELTVKAERRLANYSRNLAETRSMLEAGEITAVEFREWCAKQAIITARDTAMIRELAQSAQKATVTARGMVGKEMPKVYAECANFTAFTIDKAIGRNTMFSLLNQDAALYLLQDNQWILPMGDELYANGLRWHSQKLTSAVTQGLLQGESVPDVAARIRQVTSMDYAASERAARTALTCAENMGRQYTFEKAREKGITGKKEWIATLDGRTRDSHRELDGERVDIMEKFSNGLVAPGDPNGEPAEVWNCFIGSTKVAADSEVLRSYKHEYEGELVTVHTSSGVEFTCTPNHPILTTGGWRDAKSLDLGDDLLVTGFANCEIAGCNPDVDHVQPSMEAVHEFFDVLFSDRTSCLGVNFHGDVAASEVEIISKERLLRLDAEASSGQPISELILEDSDALGFGKGARGIGFSGIMGASSGGLGGESVLLSLVCGHGTHADAHGFGATTPFDISLVQDAVDNASAYPEFSGESLGGLASNVFADKVIGIEVGSAKCHVYNLQTVSGYYFASSNNGNYIIAHNCRCSMDEVIDEMADAQLERWSKLPDDVDYDDWKSGAYHTDRHGVETKASMRARGIVNA